MSESLANNNVTASYLDESGGDPEIKQTTIQAPETDQRFEQHTVTLEDGSEVSRTFDPVTVEYLPDSSERSSSEHEVRTTVPPGKNEKPSEHEQINDSLSL